jgi:hypothetical protein
MLRNTQNDAHGHYCCYKAGGAGNSGALEPLINGYGRIYIHSPTHGVEVFEEGHFNKGKQDDFGRVFKMEKTMQKRYYTNYQTYVGWWAQNQKGIGIAHTDDVMKSGMFLQNNGFPNDGRSFSSPSNSELTPMGFDSFEYRNPEYSF